MVCYRSVVMTQQFQSHFDFDCLKKDLVVVDHPFQNLMGSDHFVVCFQDVISLLSDAHIEFLVPDHKNALSNSRINTNFLKFRDETQKLE